MRNRMGKIRRLRGMSRTKGMRGMRRTRRVYYDLVGTMGFRRCVLDWTCLFSWNTTTLFFVFRRYNRKKSSTSLCHWSHRMSPLMFLLNPPSHHISLSVSIDIFSSWFFIFSKAIPNLIVNTDSPQILVYQFLINPMDNTFFMLRRS